jgi:hypothetical protein
MAGVDPESAWMYRKELLPVLVDLFTYINSLCLLMYYYVFSTLSHQRRTPSLPVQVRLPVTYFPQGRQPAWRGVIVEKQWHWRLHFLNNTLAQQWESTSLLEHCSATLTSDHVR